MIRTITLSGLVLLQMLTAPLRSGYAEDLNAHKRTAMVAQQIASRGIKDQATLAAMRKVPRHLFVSPDLVSQAYADRPLPIGYGQTISQPYVVAYMTETLGLTGREKVLEIGTGSGYQAAVLAETAGQVFSIEIVPELYAQARTRLKDLGYGAIQLKHDDGYYGWPDQGPFDRIIVTCAAGHIPPPLLEQLKPGGRMVIPVGQKWMVQSLALVEKDKDGQVTTRSLLSVSFVPLTRSR